MSEYQAYYFARAERPLSGVELEAVEQLSSHIRVGAHSAFVHYHYGSFKHDPVRILERWFDVLVYYANWGSQTIAFRFDSDRVDVNRLITYAVNNYPTLRGMRSRMEAAGVLPDDGSPKLVKKAIEQKRWQESHSPELSFDFSLLRA